MKSDIELLGTYNVSKSESSFRTLVDRHLNWVYSVALRQVGGDAHLAQDVCQEVFASLARKAGTLLEFAALEGWLFKATRFAASDLVRSERRRRERELEASVMEEGDVSEFGSLDWESAGELLDEAIELLREDERDAVCMRFLEDERFAEIGERLGIAENTARMRVNRAVEKLHGILTSRGVKSSTAAVAATMGAHRLVSAPAGLVSAILESSFVSTTGSIGILATWKLWTSVALGVSAVGVGAAFYLDGDVEEEVETLGLAEVSGELEAVVVEPVVVEPVFKVPSEVAAVESGREQVENLFATMDTGGDYSAEVLETSWVKSQDGVIVLDLECGLKKTFSTRKVELRAGAVRRDGVALSIDADQARELKKVLMDRIGAIGLMEMENRSFKEDLGIVLEEDIMNSLGFDNEIKLYITRLVVR